MDLHFSQFHSDFFYTHIGEKMTKAQKDKQTRDNLIAQGKKLVPKEEAKVKRKKRREAKTSIFKAMKAQRHIWGDMIDKNAVRNMIAEEAVRDAVDPDFKMVFDGDIKNLIERNLIEEHSNGALIKFTTLGEQKAGALPRPATNTEQLSVLRETIKDDNAKMIFDVLSDGQCHSRWEFQDAVGPGVSSSALGNLIASLGRMTERDDGGREFRLKNHAFPEGRPDGADGVPQRAAV